MTRLGEIVLWSFLGLDVVALLFGPRLTRWLRRRCRQIGLA